MFIQRKKITIDTLFTDNAYFSEDAYDHLVATAWIPFLDTHEGNGGMQVSAGWK